MASKSRKDIKTARAEPQESAGTQRGFLRRWSERKVQARTQEKLPASSEAPPTQVNEPASPLTDADMPAIDTLDENSDYRGFLSPKVSDELRRLALRKLFHLPKFNIRDGLDDYDEDYRTFEALGNIVTAHERHQLERQQQEDQERLAPAKEKTEKTTLAENESKPAQDAPKRERPNEETAAYKPDDSEELKEDDEDSRHG